MGTNLISGTEQTVAIFQYFPLFATVYALHSLAAFDDQKLVLIQLVVDH